jgi:competence protein ComEA
MSVKSLILVVVLSIISPSSFAEVININEADAATFQYYLKGIGVKKAESIIKYRTEHKRFNTVAEIKEVRGIGKKIFKRIKENLSLTEGVVSVSKTKTKVIKKKVKNKTVAEKTIEEIENTETKKSNLEYL